MVVKKTTLETNSASLSYLVAKIDTRAADGIAESKITTDRDTPVILRALTASKPSIKPTPTRKKEANNVVGNELILTLERL